MKAAQVQEKEVINSEAVLSCRGKGSETQKQSDTRTVGKKHEDNTEAETLAEQNTQVKVAGEENKAWSAVTALPCAN